MHLDGARWERADHEWGFPDGVASDIALDANGTLWGSPDKALNPAGGGQRAGIAYFILNSSNGTLILKNASFVTTER